MPTYCYPIQEILTTYDFGYNRDSYVIQVSSGKTEPVTVQTFNNWTAGVDYNIVQVESINKNDKLLGVEAYTGGGSHSEYANIPISGVSFAYRYKIYTVEEVNCLYTNRKITINNLFSYLPNQEIYVYDGTDFFWKKSYDIQINDNLIKQNSYTTIVTGMTYDDCTNNLFFNIEIKESVNQRIALFNGTSTDLIIGSTPVVGVDNVNFEDFDTLSDTGGGYE